MLLTKEIAVYLNLAACQFKQYTAMMLRNNSIDLTPEQFLLIDLLWNQGPMSQQKLADSMHKDKNSITKLVDALEAKGFVERQRDKNDRRSNTVVPTEKSQAIKDRTKEFGISMLDGMLDGISEDELRSFLSTLDKISGNLK